MLNGFKNPPVENRPRPFWFFNGDMERDEIRYQILEMKEKGLGGFFLCARQGLRVPYLSREWFDLCRFAVDVAHSGDEQDETPRRKTRRGFAEACARP